MRVLPLTFAALVFAGCTGKSDDTSEETGDSAVDDTGETGDTDPPPIHYTSLAGSLTYFQAENDVVVCDADVGLTSREYTGDCDGCEFAFYIDSEITRDDGSEDCVMFPPLSFVPGAYGALTYRDLFIKQVHKVGGSGYNFYNVLYTGYSATYYGNDYPGPYYYLTGYGGGILGRTTFRDKELVLDWYLNIPPYYNYNYAYLDACGADELPLSKTYSAADGVTRTSRLTCDRTTGDVWTFDVPDQAALAISLDTLAKDTAFDPLLVINGPDGCTQVLAQDNFLCTYPPPTFLCPAWEDPRATGGTWQVTVLNMGSCSGDYAEYAISVEGVSDITLTSDDFAAFEKVGDSFFLTVLMNATLTAEE